MLKSLREASRTSQIQRDTAWNALAQLSPAITVLVLTPYLVNAVGVQRYGVFALVTSLLNLMTAFDGGVGASLVRFFSVHLAAGRADAAGRLVGSATLLFLTLGALLSGITWRFAGAFAGVLHADQAVRRDAETTLSYVGLLVTVMLVGSVFRALMQAQGQWRPLALIVTAGSLTFALVSVLLVSSGHGVGGLVWAYALQQLVIGVGAFALCLRLLRAARLGMLTRSELRTFFSFAARMQLNKLSSLFNLQADTLIIASFLPIAAVGYYSIGAQLAGQIRNLPLAGLAPLATRMAREFGSAGLDAAAASYVEMHYAWIRYVGGYGAIATASVPVVVLAWMGPRYLPSAIVAALLTAGNAVNLCTGTLSSFVNAVGRPGLEVRYGLVVSGLNLALTVPAAATFGLYGVVAGTALAQSLGSPYLVRVARLRLRPDLPGLAAPLPWFRILFAALATAALSWSLLHLLPLGVAGFLLATVPAGIAFVGYIYSLQRWPLCIAEDAGNLGAVRRS